MRMRNLSFLSKKVRRYGHILRSALFMCMKTKFCRKKYNFQCNFSQKKVWLDWKKILYFNQDFINIVFLMRLSFLSKKDKKKVRLGLYYDQKVEWTKWENFILMSKDFFLFNKKLSKPRIKAERLPEDQKPCISLQIRILISKSPIICINIRFLTKLFI